MNAICKVLSATLFVCILFSLTNCASSKKAEVKKTEVKKVAVKAVPKKSSTEDFNKFYNKFHSDSVFQMSRIKFPLEGMRIEGDIKEKITAENWRMMKGRIYDVDTTQYKVQYKKTDLSFSQKVWIKNSDFKWECRFDVIKGKWYLVYVLDQNL